MTATHAGSSRPYADRIESKNRLAPGPGPLHVKLFADGADLASILSLRDNPAIRGFTTNPTLMRKAGVLDYEVFARSLLRAAPDRPVSFEAFAENKEEMEAQARTIARWGPNVNVKVPVTDSSGVFLGPLIERLSHDGIVVNVTAILTLNQVERVVRVLDPATPAIVSVFAGRIADTGVDPVPIMKQAKRILAARPRAELLWASPRELFNVFQADAAGCDIITVLPEILSKLHLIGKNLTQYSLETVAMFERDARDANYHIATAAQPERKSQLHDGNSRSQPVGAGHARRISDPSDIAPRPGPYCATS